MRPLRARHNTNGPFRLFAIATMQLGLLAVVAPLNAEELILPKALQAHVAPLPEPLPATGVTLAELEQIALDRNPTIAQAVARIEAARGTWLQAGLCPNPTFGYQANEVGNEGAAGQHGLYLGQTLITANKLGLNRAVAMRQIDQAQQQLAIQRQRVLNDARRHFYDVLLAQQAVALNEQLVQIGNVTVRTAEQLKSKLEVSEIDVLQARVSARTASLNLIQANNRHRASWRSMTAVIAAPEMQFASLEGDAQANLPEFTWEEALTRLQTSSPELTAASANLDRARWAVEAAIAGGVPNWQVQGSVAFDDSTNDVYAGVQFGRPLAIHNRNQGNIRRTRAEVVAAERELERILLNLQSRLATAYEEYSTAREQLAIYDEKILPDAKRTLDLVQHGYSQGQLGFLTVLTAQRTYFESRINRLNALRKVRSQSVLIEGMLLQGGLAGN